MTLNALAALFLLNVHHLENRKYLVDNNFIRSNMILNNKWFLNSKEISTIQPIIIKTELFGYIWGNYNNYPWDILDPGNVYGL